MEDRTCGSDGASGINEEKSNDPVNTASYVQVGPSWRRLSYHRQRAQVVGYVRPSIIEDIKEQLHLTGGGVYEEFRDSVFGHFLDFGYDGFSNCNAVLHALAAMEVRMSDASESECWFHVGEQSIRFSRREFAMVSGLRFSGSTFDPNRVVEPPETGIYRRYWPQGDRVTAKDLRGLFTNGTFRESPADALKVAKVLFAFYMILCFDGRQTAVERWLWFLIEDTAQWETFPWGKYSFQILIHYLQNLNDVLPPGRHTKGTRPRYRPPSYHFYGPTHVLLIWAFEAIPRLGDVCATRVSDTRTPRCLRWRFPKTMVDLVDFLFDPILGNGMDTQDTSPSVLLFFGTERYVFNAGEGFQRFCIEHKIKMSKIDRIFLSRVCSETAGGLPGLLLTLSRIGHEVKVWGPKDLNYLAAAMQHFIPDELIKQFDWPGRMHDSNRDAISTPQKIDDHYILINNGFVKVYAIVLKPSQLDYGSSEENPVSSSVIYICELLEIKGKFDPQKAVSLGLKYGPKRKKLQRGESVQSDLLDIMIHPDDVLGPSVPGPIVLLIDCPTLLHLQELLSVQSFSRYYADTAENVPNSSKNVNCVIHLSPAHVTKTADYQIWMSRFGAAQHIMAGHEMKNIKVPILKASAEMGIRLNYLCPQFFPAPRFWSLQDWKRTPSGLKTQNADLATGICEPILAENFLKFQLRPHRNLGLDRSCLPNLTSPQEIIHELQSKKLKTIETSGEKACVQANVVVTKRPRLNRSALPDCMEGISREVMEIVIFGTGSSQPSMYRNVSSIFLNLFSKGSLLLDCGEATLGQLKRRFGIEGADEVVRSLRCIWISHIHADHHTGLARILAQRRDLLKGIPHDPLIVIGPVQLKDYLDAYQRLEHLDMQFLDCEHTKESHTIVESLKKVLVEAGLETLISVPVEHCEPAYGVVLKAANRVNRDGKMIPGWKLVYSGDTRPCHELIQASEGTTVLIHEATFEDDLLDEAKAKKHSTFSEALGVGDLCGAYRLILTHFSQRYPKIPKLDVTKLPDYACVAFDLMSVNLADLPDLRSVMENLKPLFLDEG